jgi:hypothetical protein
MTWSAHTISTPMFYVTQWLVSGVTMVVSYCLLTLLFGIDVEQDSLLFVPAFTSTALVMLAAWRRRLAHAEEPPGRVISSRQRARSAYRLELAEASAIVDRTLRAHCRRVSCDDRQTSAEFRGWIATASHSPSLRVRSTLSLCDKGTVQVDVRVSPLHPAMLGDGVAGAACIESVIAALEAAASARS